MKRVTLLFETVKVYFVFYLLYFPQNRENYLIQFYLSSFISDSGNSVRFFPKTQDLFEIILFQSEDYLIPNKKSRIISIIFQTPGSIAERHQNSRIILDLFKKSGEYQNKSKKSNN